MSKLKYLTREWTWTPWTHWQSRHGVDIIERCNQFSNFKFNRNKDIFKTSIRRLEIQEKKQCVPTVNTANTVQLFHIRTICLCQRVKLVPKIEWIFFVDIILLNYSGKSTTLHGVKIKLIGCVPRGEGGGSTPMSNKKVNFFTISFLRRSPQKKWSLYALPYFILFKFEAYSAGMDLSLKIRNLESKCKSGPYNIVFIYPEIIQKQEVTMLVSR